MNVRMFVLAGLLAVAVAAGAQDVKVTYNHAIDFTQFHTYAWGQQSNPNPIKNPALAKAAQERINGVMTSHGLKMVQESQNPDLVIVASGASKEQTTYSNYDPSGTIFTAGTDYGVAEQQLVGAMVVELYDVKAKNLAWRGKAMGVLNQKKPEKNVELVNKAVDKMFKGFPYAP
jgi:hypothetical protein